MRRRTNQRAAIERVIADAGRPLKPAEILDRARSDVPTLNLATVYRTLSLLAETGEICPVELPGEPPRYEPREVADRHHHHFRCTRCDAVFDLEGCVSGLKALVPRGFEMTGHDILLHGMCKDCVE